MKKSILVAAVTAFWLVNSAPAFAGQGLAVHVTNKSVAMAKLKSKRIFTRSGLDYRLTKETPTSMLFSKTFPKSYAENVNELKGRAKGKTVSQVELTFSKKGKQTKVAGDVWMLLNPKGKNKDKYNMKKTATFKALKKLMAEIR